MRSVGLNPGILLFPMMLAGIGIAAFALTQGSAVPVVALTVIAAGLTLLLLRPDAALLGIALTRFSFEMAWKHQVAGFGILDFLGAGVPCGILVLLLLTRPQLGHIPLLRPVAGWAALVWVLTGMHLVTGGDVVAALESSLKFTSGTALFVLAAHVVREPLHALRLMIFWVLGTVPVALIFFSYGESRAMDYHGVARLRSLYHDPGTPAIVASLGLLSCVYMIRVGFLAHWSWRLLALFGIWMLVLSRMLFFTFSGAMTGSTLLALLMMLVLERRWLLVLGALVCIGGFTQIPEVQQRWFREIAIAQGDADPISFASGRPNRWRRFLERYEHAPPTAKVLGVHGEWGNPENGALHLWFDLGPIGAGVSDVLLLGIVVSLLRWWREEGRPDVKLFHHVVLATALGYFFSWITGTPFGWVNLQWFLWSCLGACASLSLTAREPAP